MCAGRQMHDAMSNGTVHIARLISGVAYARTAARMPDLPGRRHARRRDRSSTLTAGPEGRSRSRRPSCALPAEASGQVQVEMRSKRGAIMLRLAFLVVTSIALYVLWPSLLKVLETWPELLDLNPIWFLGDGRARSGELRLHLGVCRGWRCARGGGSASRRRSSLPTPSAAWCRAERPPAARSNGAC